MTTNIKDNKVRRLSNNIYLTACAVPIVMMLVLFSESSRGTDCSGLQGEIRNVCDDVQKLKGSGVSEFGHQTDFPLYFIADTDNTSNIEDIIFGFDSRMDVTVYPLDDHAIIERMRLTDEGRLGIGTGIPAAQLDVRSMGSPIDFDSMTVPEDGWLSYTSDVDIARLGLTKPIIADGKSNIEYYGLNMKVHGSERHRREHSRFESETRQYETVVGFDLVSASEYRSPDTNARNVPDFGDVSNFTAYAKHRAITLYMDTNPSGGRNIIRTGVGYAGGYTPSETLDVNGAVRIGTTSHNNAGTLRYNIDGIFEGYNGSEWVNLGAGGGSDNIIVGGEHQLVFGMTDDHRTPNNFIVNSREAPDDQAAHFPIPTTGSNYNNDDDGTSGGVSLVTGGLPRFTVKGNGNTYVHKRMSIGIGGHVDGTVLTVAGGVHIGPDNVTPARFNYADEISDYLLWVQNGIVSEDFAIANVDNWSDHVLQDDYDLKPLSEVEEFIQEEGHLPGVPSAKDVKKSGYTVHEMTRTLLEKVEELTLHTIAQQKALEEQLKKLETQQAEIVELRAQLGEGRSGMQAASFHVKTAY